MSVIDPRERAGCAAAAASARRSAARAERPRISVFRSNRGISAQLIDDIAGRTLAAVNWTEAELRALPAGERARRAGELLGERAKAAGVSGAVSSTAAATSTTAGQGACGGSAGIGGLAF